MSNKKFILNADDLGLSQERNRAILEGYDAGILKSASLIANGKYFQDAIDRIIPHCRDIDIGIHLNITEGASLCPNLDQLVNADGNFNNNFTTLFFKTLNVKNEILMQQIESEFRIQIEKVLKSREEITNINSHNHIHAIPRIFELVCKLAKEYGIKVVRTQFEIPYLVPDFSKYLSLKFPKNLLQVGLFDLFTLFNEQKLKKYNLYTNEYLIGNCYRSMLNSLCLVYGLHAITYDKVVVEGLIHPARYEDGTIDEYFVEFQMTKNQKLKDKIENLGYEITNYKNILQEINQQE